MTLVRPLLLCRQHLEAALVTILHDIRPTVAPVMVRVVRVVRVTFAPDALALLEVVDARARHHRPTHTVPNGWLAFPIELALAPLLFRHFSVGIFIPEHEIALGAQAREDEAYGSKAFGRFPVGWVWPNGYKTFFATLDHLHFEPLLVVDVLDHAIFLVGESASGLARVALGVEVLGVATTALDGAVEAVFVRALAEALRLHGGRGRAGSF